MPKFGASRVLRFPGAALGGGAVVAPQRIIVDTDLDSDVDDVCALMALFDMQLKGECQVICGITNSRLDTVPHCLRTLLNHAGLTSVPVGAYQGSLATIDATSSFATQVAFLNRPVYLRASYPDAVTQMRTSLAAAPDGSVVFISIGSITNYPALLQSAADGISPLTGAALVAQKVARVHIMGGRFDNSSFSEANIAGDRTGANYAAANSPVPIYWSGFEIGNGALTSIPTAGYWTEDPCVKPWTLSGYVTRASWDITAVVDAVRGISSGLWTYSAPGDVSFNASNYTSYSANPAGKSRYLIRTDASGAGDTAMATYLQGLINDYMTRKGLAARPANNSLLAEYTLLEGTGQTSDDVNLPNATGFMPPQPQTDFDLTLGYDTTSRAGDPTWSSAGINIASTDCLWIPADVWWERPDISIVAVVRPTAATANHMIATREGGGTQLQYQLRMTSARNLSLVMRGAGGTNVVVADTTTPPFTLNSWHLVSFRVQGTTYEARINGVVVLSGTLPGLMYPGTGNPTLIGGRYNTSTAPQDLWRGDIRYIAFGGDKLDTELTTMETRARTFATSQGITLP